MAELIPLPDSPPDSPLPFRITTATFTEKMNWWHSISDRLGLFQRAMYYLVDAWGLTVAPCETLQVVYQIRNLNKERKALWEEVGTVLSGSEDEEEVCYRNAAEQKLRELKEFDAGARRFQRVVEGNIHKQVNFAVNSRLATTADRAHDPRKAPQIKQQKKAKTKPLKLDTKVCMETGGTDPSIPVEKTQEIPRTPVPEQQQTDEKISPDVKSWAQVLMGGKGNKSPVRRGRDIQSAANATNGRDVIERAGNVTEANLKTVSRASQQPRLWAQDILPVPALLPSPLTVQIPVTPRQNEEIKTPTDSVSWAQILTGDKSMLSMEAPSKRIPWKSTAPISESRSVSEPLPTKSILPLAAPALPIKPVAPVWQDSEAMRKALERANAQKNLMRIVKTATARRQSELDSPLEDRTNESALDSCGRGRPKHSAALPEDGRLLNFLAEEPSEEAELESPESSSVIETPQSNSAWPLASEWHMHTNKKASKDLHHRQ